MSIIDEIQKNNSQDELKSMRPDSDKTEWNHSNFPEIVESSESAGKLIVEPDLYFIERTSFASLLEQNGSMESQSKFGDTLTESIVNERSALSEEQKAEIKEETGWSAEIINSIGSWEEYEIYQRAGLMESEINGRKCLIRDDIDLNYEDEDGISNRERMNRGLSPITNNGEIVELHHIGQRADSPLAELSRSEHRGGGNDSILHDKTKETEVHGDGNNWSGERTQYWKSRVNLI